MRGWIETSLNPAMPLGALESTHYGFGAQLGGQLDANLSDIFSPGVAQWQGQRLR
jgi:hypothetical protein